MTAREIYDLKIANHICPRCNGANDSDRVYCEACREKDKKDRMIVKSMREAMGVCIKCGCNDPEDGSKYCSVCRNKIKRDNEELRKWCKENGLCPRCRKNALVGNEKTCIECRAYNAERWRDWMDKNPSKGDKEANKLAKRIEYKTRKESGLCTRCGKPLNGDTHVTCARCRTKANEGRRCRNYSKKIEREKHQKNGGCFFCNNMALPGKKVCEKHYKHILIISNNEKMLEHRKRVAEASHRAYEARKGAI